MLLWKPEQHLNIKQQPGLITLNANKLCPPYWNWDVSRLAVVVKHAEVSKLIQLTSLGIFDQKQSNASPDLSLSHSMACMSKEAQKNNGVYVSFAQLITAGTLLWRPIGGH